MHYNAAKNQDREQAKLAPESLCSVEKKNPRILPNLGVICQRTGDAASAIAAYHKSAYILKEQGFILKALALYNIILGLRSKKSRRCQRLTGWKTGTQSIYLLEEIFDKNPEALRRLHDFYECRIEDTLKKTTSATKK